MKTFTPKEIVHAKAWDLAPEFRIIATGTDDPDDIRHVDLAVCAGLSEIGAIIATNPTREPRFWSVKMPVGWEIPEKPVVPADLVETEMDLERFVRCKPWEVPALVRIRQQPTDCKDTIMSFLHLVLPGTLQTHDCDVIDSSGSLKKGDAMLLIWVRTGDAHRAAMKQSVKLMESTVDMDDPEVSIPIKAQAMISLHPDKADIIMAKAAEALKLHRSRQ